jgi:hypothetical protein
VWAYDFVHDACANGQKIQCLTIIDEFTRECHAIEPADSSAVVRVCAHSSAGADAVEKFFLTYEIDLYLL